MLKTSDNDCVRGPLFIRLVFWVLNFESKVPGLCEYSVKLRPGIWEHSDTARQRDLAIAAMVINLDMSPVMDFVMFDGAFPGRYIARWVVFWMLYGLMGRFSDFVPPMGRLLDVVWCDLRIAKKNYEFHLSDKPPTVTAFRCIFAL